MLLTEILSKRDVLSTLVEKDFKSRYKAKALGRLWSVADPLVMVVIYTIVFAHILQVAERFYPIFLLLGLTPFRFFTNSVNGAAASVTDNTALVKRVAFPRVMLPVAVVLSHSRHFFIELSLVVALFLYYPEAFIPTLNLVWLPVIFGVQMVFATGVALMVSALNVRYRDTQYILNSVVLVMTWLTPTFYSFNVVPESLAHILMWNPMVGVVEGYRSVLLHGSRPSFTLMGSAGIAALAVFIVGAIVFRKYEHVFADYI
ncbi:MAG: ABC transporter permease [Myxococcales bacterium]